MTKRIVTLCVFSLMIFLLSACGEKEEFVLEKTEIRIMTMFGGTDPSTKVFEAQLERFAQQFPQVELVNMSMTSVGDEYRRAVKTGFSTGNEADIVFFYTGADIQGIVDIGAVVPYEEVWSMYPEVGEDIKASVLEQMREEDGKIYSLPLTGFYEGLFVNTELFERYDVPLPTDWDTLMNAILIFRENGINPIAGPLAQSQYLIEHFIFARSGVEVYQNPLYMGSEIPQPWRQGLLDIKDVYEMGAFSDNALTLDVEQAQQMFIEEEAAMILEGSWFIGRCSEALQSKMSVMPMPTPPGGLKENSDIIAGYSAGYYISRQSYDDLKKRKLMVDLIYFLTRSDAILEVARANGGIPSADVELDGLTDLMVQGYEMVDNASHTALPIDSRLTTEAFNHIVKDGVPYIVFGEKTAEEVLQEAQRIQNK